MHRTPPTIPGIILHESTFKELASTVHKRCNQFLSKLLDSACGRDLPFFFLVFQLWSNNSYSLSTQLLQLSLISLSLLIFRQLFLSIFCLWLEPISAFWILFTWVRSCYICLLSSIVYIPLQYYKLKCTYEIYGSISFVWL